VILGVEPLAGFAEFGFHLPEEFGGTPGRWTQRVATLRVPLDPQTPPRLLALETMVPGRDGTHLQLLANGVELWSGPVPAQPWSRTFSLEQVPLGRELLIKLKSDTFSPAEAVEGSGDSRRLGVVVRAIRLTARDDFGAPAGSGPDGGER
jgi:hypothetical protein